MPPSKKPPSITPSRDRKSTRLNSSHTVISYAVFSLKKKQHRRRRLFQVENSFSIKADEVYLIATSFVPWLVWCLRIGEDSFFDLAEQSRGWDIDHQTLSQLTNR